MKLYLNKFGAPELHSASSQVNIFSSFMMFLTFPVLPVGLLVCLCARGFPAGPGFPSAVGV